MFAAGKGHLPLTESSEQLYTSAAREIVPLRRLQRTQQAGRDTKTGHFIPVEVPRRRKATAVVETVKTGGKSGERKGK